MINKAIIKSGIYNYFPSILRFFNTGRLEPSFFIVGVQKCGTTTLYDQLMKVKGFKPGLIKENDILATKNADVDIFKLSFPYSWSAKHTGDASHLHTYTPYGLKNIKTNFPDAKLIVILRNPIKRAYSHFNMDQKIGYIPKDLTFEQYIDLELKLRENILNENDIDEVYNKMKFFSNKYGWALTRSIYHVYVKAVIESNMPYYVVFLEDLESKYETTFKGVLDFLNINEDIPPPEISNKGIYKTSLKTETNNFLEEFFAPHNKKLEELLNRKLPW
jgi:lipopolysaccharide transport system ATP-binding protein